MKKYLFIALAALGFAACAEKMDDNSPVQKGELEESYIAINLMAADVDTRALEGDTYGYEDGTNDERKVVTAYFFFFDENGYPFNVTATAPGGDKNHLSLQLTTTSETQTENVSDISNAVLVLNTYKGVYPSQIVAVLNWVPTDDTYTLEALREELSTLGGVQGGFVMSNSVYMDGANKVVDAVPLTAANIKTTSQAAIENPVNIYVERIAAKVVLTASGKIEGVQNMILFDTQKNSKPVLNAGTSSEIDVYVKLNGWELYNDYSTSTLLKNIDKWDVATLGLTWNDIPYYRCYWAKSQATTQEDSFAWSYENHSVKGFPTSNGFKVANDASYASGTYTYCGENTNQKTVTTDPRTKVILKGQLMQKKGDAYEQLELARWYGTEYAGNEALRTAVANSLKYTLYYLDGTKYVSIAPVDLECVSGIAGAEAYEVGFKLSTAGEGKNWYKYSSEKGYESLGDIASDANKINTNAELAKVEPALVYTNGNTYYFIDIEHLGTKGAKYGVVRNHVYQIDINSITGYGTPVYIGTSSIVTPPEYPEDEESSYVAARINVLSWKVVKQEVNVGQ